MSHVGIGHNQEVLIDYWPLWHCQVERFVLLDNQPFVDLRVGQTKPAFFVFFNSNSLHLRVNLKHAALERLTISGDACRCSFLSTIGDKNKWLSPFLLMVLNICDLPKLLQESLKYFVSASVRVISPHVNRVAILNILLLSFTLSE